MNIVYLGVGPTKSLSDGQRLSIEVIDQSEENYIKFFTNQIRKIVSQEEIQLGAVRGKHYRFSDPMVDTLDASTYYFNVFTITHNNLLYVINPVSYNSEITQILSTFKFTR